MAAAPGGWKADFDIGDRAYLNGANHGPFPRVAIEAVEQALALKRDPSRIDDAIYFALPDRVRAAAAPFFGCEPHEIAVTTGASTGVGLLANGIDWKPGDQVIIPAGEFPANYLPWFALRERGVEVRVVAPDAGLTPDDVAAAIRPSTRVVAVGQVNFATGYRADVEAIGNICAEHGIAYLIDASQGFCSVPIDVRACRATVVTAAGYKWMCSPYGTGLFYVHPDWIERLPVPVVNWSSIVGSEDFNKMTELDVEYRPGASRWDAPETASFLNGFALAASLEFLGAIGAPRIFAHSTALIDRLIEALPAGFDIGSRLDEAHRSAIVRITGADADRTTDGYRRCVAAGVSVSLRESGIRVSPGVWNDDSDVDRLVEQLRAAAGSG